MEMAIPGKLSWSFYPHLGMQAAEVTITDGAVFTAQLKQLVLTAKLRPLLHRHLELSKVSIEELNLNQLQLTQVESKVKWQDQNITLLL